MSFTLDKKNWPGRVFTFGTEPRYEACVSRVPPIPLGTFAGYGCDRRGGFVVIDEHGARWQRRRLWLRDASLTLESSGGKFCTGRHDLDSGESQPCPERAALRPEAPEQCNACWRATGFNPAFYNTSEISPQQERRNREPHAVYLAHFGAGIIKVGMTYARRGVGRLLEQGARIGVILACFPDAYLARALERGIAEQLHVSEAVRPSRKRQLLEAPFSVHAARAELETVLAHVRELGLCDTLCPEWAELDEYYGGAALFTQRLTDLSETEPVAISGRAVGMIGDVLLVSQGGQVFTLSLQALVGCGVRLTPEERANRWRGQLALPF
jgi:hypothetical protein